MVLLAAELPALNASVLGIATPTCWCRASNSDRLSSTGSGSCRHAGLVQLAPHGRCVDVECSGDGGQRVAGFVGSGCGEDVGRAQLAPGCSTCHAALFEACGDGVAMHTEALGQLRNVRPARYAATSWSMSALSNLRCTGRCVGFESRPGVGEASGAVSFGCA